MGEFFDAIYTRGIDAEILPRQLADAARELNCCFLLAPEIRGWRAIYCSRTQDGKVAKALHQRLRTEVLYTLVHDGDIFCYDYYRDGKLVDEFNSRPDYFGKVSAKKRQSQGGHPDRLLLLLRDLSDVERLERILRHDAEDPLDANEQLMEFGELLGLPNCATSYDYLLSDEEDEAIERRGEFVHIPDLEPEKAARASAYRSVRVEMDRMRADGLLLFEQSPAPLAPVADPAGSGFVTSDRDMTFRGIDRPIYRIAPPFGEGPKPLGIVTAVHPNGVVLSASGRLLAAIQQRQIAVWDRETSRQIAAMELEPPINAVRFLGDEKSLVAGGRRLDVFSLPDGKRLRTIETMVGHAMALHPSGSLAVIVSGRATVQVVDLDAGRVVYRFFLDSQRDLGFMEKMQLALVTAAIGKHRQDAHRQLARMGAGEGGFAPELDEPLTAEDPRAFLFSPDGAYLICGTGKAAWVFRWRTLLAAGVESPPPLYRYRPESQPSGMPMAFLMPMNFSSGVGAVVYDAEMNWALLGCADGVVRRMDLASGEVSTLFTVPGGNLIQRMAMSADGSLLCTVDVSVHDIANQLQATMGGSPLAAAIRDDGPRDRTAIWDYRKLRGRQGN